MFHWIELYFVHTLGSFGLDLNIMAEVSASWNIIVTGCSTLNMWVRL